MLKLPTDRLNEVIKQICSDIKFNNEYNEISETRKVNNKILILIVRKRERVDIFSVHKIVYLIDLIDMSVIKEREVPLYNQCYIYYKDCVMFLDLEGRGPIISYEGEDTSLIRIK